MWFWSAADSVMILKVEPGGWGPETASPDSARMSPFCGRTTATPPSRPPSALAAAACTDGTIVERSECPLRTGTLRTTRCPKRSSAPERPPSRAL